MVDTLLSGDLSFLRLARCGAHATPGLPQPRLRVRPGERPVWVDLRLAPDEALEWRARAAARGLAVDVWLGVLLEHEIARHRVTNLSAGLWRSVVAAAEPAGREVRLAPTDELRRWITVLNAGEEAAGDDLPSVVLATRLVAQLPHDRREKMLLEAAASGSEAMAILVERAAAAHGQTLEAWAYFAALAACPV